VISYPRRQQYRRLQRAATVAAAALGFAVLALLAGAAGAPALAGVLMIVAVGLAAYARSWGGLAGRSREGARSERAVRRELACLRRKGWRLRHALRWPGGGDIDHVAIAPREAGVAFVIETKTRTKTYRPEHLARASTTARWLMARRRRWCPHGAMPVVCLVRARGIQRVEDGVLIVSLDRLPGALQTAAGARERPAFLAPASGSR
jgi:hypothetical protein